MKASENERTVPVYRQGGGIYGSLILGWQTAAYVEKTPTAKPSSDSALPTAGLKRKHSWRHRRIQPHRSDRLRRSNRRLTGGFPCQPFSVAGKRQGADDERYLWSGNCQTIQVVRPGFVFENVPWPPVRPGRWRNLQRPRKTRLPDKAPSGAWKF